MQCSTGNGNEDLKEHFSLFTLITTLNFVRSQLTVSMSVSLSLYMYLYLSLIPTLVHVRSQPKLPADCWRCSLVPPLTTGATPRWYTCEHWTTKSFSTIVTLRFHIQGVHWCQPAWYTRGLLRSEQKHFHKSFIKDSTYDPKMLKKYSKKKVHFFEFSKKYQQSNSCDYELCPIRIFCQFFSQYLHINLLYSGDICEMSLYTMKWPGQDICTKLVWVLSIVGLSDD